MDHKLLALINEWFTYDAENGEFRWRKRRANNAPIGSIPGGMVGRKGDQYRVIHLAGQSWRVHHLVWFMHHGELPTVLLDHIDGNRENNRISNLRVASLSQNRANARRNRNNKSGMRGVWWNAKNKRWHAAFVKDGKDHWLGYYTTKEEAVAVMSKAFFDAHGEFARLDS